MVVPFTVSPNALLLKIDKEWISVDIDKQSVRSLLEGALSIKLSQKGE